MSSKVQILGFTGSLREESYNRAALEAAQELLPANTSLEIVSLANLPAYNQQEAYNQPEVVCSFIEKLQQADALLIVTPEYKGLLSRVLKNALNWVTTLDGKPVALMGIGRASGGVQEHATLRQELARLQARVIDAPELYITSGWEKLDDEGKLTDRVTRQQIAQLLVALQENVLEPALAR